MCGSDITIQEKSLKFNKAGTVYLNCRSSYSWGNGPESGVTTSIQILKNGEAVKEFSNDYVNSLPFNLLSLEVDVGDELSFKGKCSLAYWWINQVIIVF